MVRRQAAAVVTLVVAVSGGRLCARRNPAAKCTLQEAKVSLFFGPVVWSGPIWLPNGLKGTPLTFRFT